MRVCRFRQRGAGNKKPGALARSGLRMGAMRLRDGRLPRRVSKKVHVLLSVLCKWARILLMRGAQVKGHAQADRRHGADDLAPPYARRALRCSNNYDPDPECMQGSA